MRIQTRIWTNPVGSKPIIFPRHAKRRQVLITANLEHPCPSTLIPWGSAGQALYKARISRHAVSPFLRGHFLHLVLLHRWREHSVSQWLIMTLTMWKLILLQCLEFPPPPFSSPFTSHSSTGLAVYSPLPHWKHHYNLPRCKFVLCKNALATAWRGIFQTSLTSPQAWLPAWHGAHTEMKTEHNIVWETIKPTLYFQGAQLEQQPFLCGSLENHLDVLWQQTPNFLSDSRLQEKEPNHIILSVCLISLCSFNVFTEENFITFLAPTFFFHGNESWSSLSPSMEVRITLTFKVRKKDPLRRNDTIVWPRH